MVNSTKLIGRLGKNPELKTLPSGASYARFSIATTESYKDKDDEWQDVTQWHNIIAWRKLAEAVEKNLKKGNLVYLEGQLQYSEYEKDGVNMRNAEIKLDKYRKLEFGKGGNFVPPPQEPPSSSKTGDEAGDDDLPF